VGPEEPAVYERGDVISSKNLGSFSKEIIRQMKYSSNVTLPFSLEYAVEHKSITYSTIDGKGNQVIASGALVIPSGTQNLPLLSMQHGTETKGNHVASESAISSVEGTTSLITASLGYVTAVPDYLGLGVAEQMHPYLHAKSLIPCVVDFMRAARSYCSTNGSMLNGQVFLTGYSEGGYVTLVTQRAIELEHPQEFTLTAVAPMAGPYDLHGTVQAVFQSAQYNHIAYVAYIVTAYNDIYGWNRLDDFLNAPYSSMMRSLFDGSKTYEEIVSQLPSTFSVLVKSTFVANVRDGSEQGFLAAMQENTILDWKPRAPIHFFHGDADDVSPYQNSLTASNRLKANGGTNIQLTTIPGGNHATSSMPAIVGTIGWFEQMRKSNQFLTDKAPLVLLN
jgi:dienelactone hydrolase